jgi:hypothetical protein
LENTTFAMPASMTLPQVLILPVTKSLLNVSWLMLLATMSAATSRDARV